MATSWMTDFHLDAIGVSNLSAAFFYAYVLMQIPVGFLNDRFNPKRILTLGAFLVAAGCISMAFTENTIVAYIDRILMGIGSSFGFVSMLYTCSRWFPANRFALAVGLSESLGMVGVALTTVCSAWLLTHFGWRKTVLTSGIVAVLLMIAAHLMVRDKPSETEEIKEKVGFWQSVRMTLKERQVWLSGFYGFFAFAIINAIASLWGVPFLENVYDLSLTLSASIVSMILYGLAIGLPLITVITNVIGSRKPVILVASACTAFFLSVTLFVPNLPTWLLFLLFFLTGLTGCSYVHGFAISKESMPESIHGVGLAMTNMMLMLGAPIMQIVMGYIITHDFFGLSHSLDLTYRLALGLVPAGIALSFFIALGFKGRSPSSER